MLKSHSVEDSVEALSRLTLRVADGAPNIGQVRLTIREVEDEKRRVHRGRSSGEDISKIPIAPPERLEQHFKDLSAAVDLGLGRRAERYARSGSQTDMFKTKRMPQPVLDENHDWGATFAVIDAGAAMRVTEPIRIASPREREMPKVESSPHSPTSAIPERDDAALGQPEPLNEEAWEVDPTRF